MKDELGLWELLRQEQAGTALVVTTRVTAKHRAREAVDNFTARYSGGE